MEAKKILITGGSGMIGQHLTEKLTTKGHEVAWLSRSPEKIKQVKAFKWDIATKEIDKEAVKWADVVVHLAGAGVAEKRWTTKRKEEIIESRVVSADLITDTMRELGVSKTFISSSGVNYYGDNSGDRLCHEDDDPGDGFLADVTIKWELAADKAAELGARVVKLRTGMVLSEKGGALEQLVAPVKWWVGSPLASGKQYMSWIHIDDLTNMYLKAIEDDNMSGVYNAVAPNPVRNKEMVKTIAKVMKKPLWALKVPAFALYVLLGEMAVIVIKGNNVSSEKIAHTGFTFQYTQLSSALQNLLG